MVPLWGSQLCRFSPSSLCVVFTCFFFSFQLFSFSSANFSGNTRREEEGIAFCVRLRHPRKSTSPNGGEGWRGDMEGLGGAQQDRNKSLRERLSAEGDTKEFFQPWPTFVLLITCHCSRGWKERLIGSNLLIDEGKRIRRALNLSQSESRLLPPRSSEKFE